MSQSASKSGRDTHSEAKSKLFVIAAPSGAGKTSIVKALLEREPNIRFSVSYTTRKKRETETDDVDYKFISKRKFGNKAKAGDFLEYALVFDNYYSTGRAEVQKLLDDGYNVLLEIDWQGAQQVRDAMPEAVTIFILPPNVAELQRRLRSRSTDSDDVIARRLRDSLSDLSHWGEFDYVVINDDFDTAVNDMLAIIHDEGEQHRCDNPDVRAYATALLD